MRVIYLISGFLLMFGKFASANDLLVVSGYGIKNEIMNIEESCPPQTICPNYWYRYEIKVRDVLLNSGEAKGNLVGVRKQHDQFIMPPEELSVFVLKKIKDAKLRKKLNSDYLVVDFSRPKTIYCFNLDAKALGVELDDLITIEPAGMWKQECISGAELMEANSDSL